MNVVSCTADARGEFSTPFGHVDQQTVAFIGIDLVARLLQHHLPICHRGSGVFGAPGNAYVTHEGVLYVDLDSGQTIRYALHPAVLAPVVHHTYLAVRRDRCPVCGHVQHRAVGCTHTHCQCGAPLGVPARLTPLDITSEPMTGAPQ